MAGNRSSHSKNGHVSGSLRDSECDTSSRPAGITQRLHSSSAPDLDEGNQLPSGIVFDKTQLTVEPFGKSRHVLPAVMLSRDQISIWSILKHAIGKDLTRITMPIVFNEPLSFLQRLAEHMEYVGLLKKAAHCDDPLKRIELVAAFSISALASNRDRVAKPFNPMLGETYELDRREDLGFRYMSEQVCHHPPVSAFHVDGDGFEYTGSNCAKLKFFGQTVDCHMKGINTLVLSKYNETYTWGNPTCSVHNLVMGKMYIEHSGIIEVKNHTTGHRVQLNLKPTAGWFTKDSLGYIEGKLLDKNKKRVRCLYGDWAEFMAACDPDAFDKHFHTWGKEHRAQKDNKPTAAPKLHSPPANRRFSTINDEDTSAVAGQHAGGSSLGVPGASTASQISVQQVLPLLAGSEVLWRANVRPELSDQYYHFTMFSLLLNEFDDVKHASLPPTDSRRRPDIRLMEEGDIDNASTEKHRLEEKQRTTAADRKKSKNEFTPLWFKRVAHPLVKDEEQWVFNATEYDKHDWSRCEAIFD